MPIYVKKGNKTEIHLTKEEVYKKYSKAYKIQRRKDIRRFLLIILIILILMFLYLNYNITP